MFRNKYHPEYKGTAAFNSICMLAKMIEFHFSTVISIVIASIQVSLFTLILTRTLIT